MGLDTMIKKLVKVGPEEWTEESIENRYPYAYLKPLDPEDSKQDISLAPGFPKDFVFKCKVSLVDYDKWLESKSTPERPLKWSDGWNWGCTGGDAYLACDKVQGVDSYITFHKAGSEHDKWTPENTVSLPLFDEPDTMMEFTHVEKLDCVLVENGDYGYCRKTFKSNKSANQFYSDMDANKPCYLFRKNDVEEYAKKYFDVGFMGAIVDKFHEGNGMFVVFDY